MIACAVALLLSPSIVLSQSTCPNADFSQGNFSSWQGYTGNYNNPAQNLGIVAGRHTIMAGAGTDPFTCGGLPVVPPGGTSSARLGNSNTGAQAERLVYSMTVSPDNALFIYQYAVVLENPDDHLPEEQPEFSMRILDNLGNPIGGSCGTYTVYGGQPGQNFQTCGGVTWLPWSTVGVDLTPYMGQGILIEFTAKDCLLTGHFGYAYISATCAPMTLDLAFCAGATEITLTAPDGFQQYDWVPGSYSGQEVTIPTPALGTVFICTMTSFSNQGNCEVDLAVEITPTVVTAGFPETAGCEDTDISFTDTSTVSNGTLTTWSWDFDDGTTSTDQSPVHSFAGPGSYLIELIATSAEGCTDTAYREIDVYAAPNAAFTALGSCISDSVTFDNQSTDVYPLTHEWDFDDGSPVMQGLEGSHFFAIPAIYDVTLTVENAMGCVASVTNPTPLYALPVIDAGPGATICPGGQVVLAASGAVSYTWDQGVLDGVAFVPAQAGMYHVTGTDANGCSSTDSVQIDFHPLPVIDAGPDQSVCIGGNVTLSGIGALLYQWDNGILDGVAFVPPLGVTVCTVTGTDLNGCEATDAVTITANPLPVVDAGNDITICPGGSLSLAASGATTYNWDNGILNGVPFSPTANGLYTVTGIDQNGCEATDIVAVSIEAPVTVNFSVDEAAGCAPLNVQFTNLSSGGANCVWTFGDGTSSSGCNGVSHLFETAGCYDITLTTTTALGCVSDSTIPNAVCVYPNPVAAFEVNPSVLTQMNPVTTMQNNSTGAVSYEWDFDDGSAISALENPTHNYGENVAEYVITLTATSEFGCIDVTQVPLSVLPELIYYVPNTFTPDGDDYNEVFKPQMTSGFDPDTYHLYIYNRWGQLVFESRDIDYGWDGSFAGEIAQDGVYTWKIEFRPLVASRSEEASNGVLVGHVNILK